jgi:uncharacterized LabA/DUF88 family protein
MNHASCFTFFVDGSNLMGSLKKLGVQVDEYGAFFNYLLTESVDVWRSSFFDSSAATARLLRVNWYEVGSMDEWNLTDQNVENSLRDTFTRDQELKRSFLALAGQKAQGQTQQQTFDEAWKLCYADVRAWYELKRKTLDGIHRFHYSVQSETDFIDIIECGHWKLDLLNRRTLEKGLDTRLAVDMVTQVQNYDVAILVSGDADAIPSLNHVKREGKQVCVIEFIKGYPPEARGRQSSSRLKVAADFVTQIYEMDLIRQKLARSVATGPRGDL